MTCTIPTKGAINELFDAKFRRDGEDKDTMLFFEEDGFDENNRKKDKKYGYGFGYECMKYGGGDNHINVFLELSKEPKAYVSGTQKVLGGGALAISAIYVRLKNKVNNLKKKEKEKKPKKKKKNQEDVIEKAEYEL